jgi:hypothetical protein
MADGIVKWFNDYMPKKERRVREWPDASNRPKRKGSSI